MKKKLLSASIYPLLLIVVGSLVVLFLLGYVVPRFSVVYESSQADLPWLSQLLLSWGQLLHRHGSEAFIIFIMLLASAVYVLSLGTVRAALLKKLWQIPKLGQTMHLYQLARFYRTLGMLIQGGIPLTRGMDMASTLLQPLLRKRLSDVQSEVREGHKLSAAMEKQSLTTAVSIRMLRVGERTGQLGEMMDHIGAFYDDEIARTIEWFTKLLEPILMMVIGFIVGLVVVLMYMPIFELAGSIQ